MKFTGRRARFPADPVGHSLMFGGDGAAFLIRLVTGMPMRRIIQLELCHTPLS